MTGSLPLPLGGSAPREVPLSRSPLVRVIAQTRFPSVLKIDSRDTMIAFQEEVGPEYPILEQAAAPQFHIEFTSGSPNVRQVTSNLWRFSTADRSWLLSLAADAVTLETSRYGGRDDFLKRWCDVLAFVERIFDPRLALRVGVRYVNQIQGESLSDLTKWVRGSLVGVAQDELRDHVTHAISEANVAIEEGVLLLRWGILPANATFDPGLLAPAPTSSWVLDIDVSSAEQRPFSEDSLRSTFRALANRAYAVFRYAITDDGLEHFGAQS